MRRRDVLISGGAALVGLSAFPLGLGRAADAPRQKVLYFTRSAGFEHPVVARKGGELSFSEVELTKMCARHNIEVVCTKDGRVFDGDLEQFAAFAFYTSGVLTNPVQGRDEPPMTPNGKKRFFAAVAAGKGFIGFHAATDSFHSEGDRVSDFVAMIGGEFIVHGRPQEATMRVASPKFPGVERLGESFKMFDEWYAQKNFAKDLHVVLVQETAGMVDNCYQRPPFPATWARQHGQGRVFYTSMGHFENVWTSDIFQQVVLGGLAWALRRVDADVSPNIDRVTPKANVLKA
jgi:type 1 glutamine amidotransferase